MGEVRRVRDPELNRVMAMKITRQEVLNHPLLLSRFVEEAQATSQLQHPGIIPVYELGKLPDGRHYYTMKEVRGRTFEAVIQDVHDAATADGWRPAPSGWTFRRLIDAFFRVCEAMAFAHERKVVHRDLKPANLMVGEHGEVMVMDWGLAKVQGSANRTPEAAELQPIVTVRAGQSMFATRAGSVTGTPAYMSPEQARGETGRISASSDVYSLGAVLYTILSGAPPYEGPTGAAVLQKVLEGPPRTLGLLSARGRSLPARMTTLSDNEAEPSIVQQPELLELLIPQELAVICQKAMSREPSERYPTAKELAAEVSRWLDGVQRKEQAIAVVEAVRSLPAEVRVLRARSSNLREQAMQFLAGIPSYESEEVKRPGWALEDEASELERQADMKELEYQQGLQGALTHFSELSEAHARLASLYHRHHQEAEAARDARATARSEALLRAYDRRSEYATYLKGDGAVTLYTNPGDAEVTLYRFEGINRRLVPQYLRVLGRTPLVNVSLSRGSYLLKVNAPGHAEVLYPVYIGRGEHWDGVPPEGGEPFPIWLPPERGLGTAVCYVPAGWFWAGGDDDAYEALTRQRVWVDGFAIRRFPISNREYLDFLNDLVNKGRVSEAMRFAPRERAGKFSQQGPLIYEQHEDGCFALAQDMEADAWNADWPAIQIDWVGAMAFSIWNSLRSGHTWRLPGELEREKAARGVDRRLYPWGDVWDASWTCVRESHAGRAHPSVVDAYPKDVSVYGVRGLGGNTQDWCVDEFDESGPTMILSRYQIPEVDPQLIECLTRAISQGNNTDDCCNEIAQFIEGSLASGSTRAARGGRWDGSARFLRSSTRGRCWPGNRTKYMGLRLVMSLLGGQ